MNLLWNIQTLVGACGRVDRAFDSRSECLGFHLQHWPYVELSGKIVLGMFISCDAAAVVHNNCKKVVFSNPCELIFCDNSIMMAAKQCDIAKLMSCGSGSLQPLHSICQTWYFDFTLFQWH